MNVLLNFFPVQSGGGQQVASNFLNIVVKRSYGHRWFVFVGKGSELYDLALRILPENHILSVNYSYLARIVRRKSVDDFIEINSIDLIYNYAPILKIRKQIPQVVRSVYSNLYFPEIDFWESYPFFTRMKKRLIDYFRLRGTLSANGLIFENRSMQERAISFFKFLKENTVYIRPSVTLFDESSRSDSFDILLREYNFKILYLSSWHLNKNIQILPGVAYQLKKNEVQVKFVLSLDRNDPAIQKLLINRIGELGVESYFTFIGKVPARYVHQVVKACNSMILLSKLECFSSNIVEAFHFQRPLIISDEPWARSECGEAVIYVNRNSAKSIANSILKLTTDDGYGDEFVVKGVEKLAEFNSPEEKALEQIRFLEDIYGRR